MLAVVKLKFQSNPMLIITRKNISFQLFPHMSSIPNKECPETISISRVKLIFQSNPILITRNKKKTAKTLGLFGFDFLSLSIGMSFVRLLGRMYENS